MRSILLTAAFTLGLLACKTTQAPLSAQAEAKTVQSAAQPKPQDGIEHLRALSSFGAIYFDFDSDALKPVSQERLLEVAHYLNRHPTIGVTIEGHCDDRGTSEYNLGLGERRANAIRSYLSHLGVRPAQLRTISYGNERPAIMGQGEDIWSKNRRGEFVTAEAIDDSVPIANDEG